MAERMPPERERHLFSWPGLGNEPPLPEVRGADDLVAMVLTEMAEPVDIIAQSMGGLIAVRAAIAAPDKVRRLVLTATSGGLPVGDLGGSDWRADYRRQYPCAAEWITETREDLSSQMGVIKAPTLLLWGDQDAISPPGVGRRLAELLPNATRKVIEGGGHDLALTHSPVVASLILDHLR